MQQSIENLQKVLEQQQDENKDLQEQFNQKLQEIKQSYEDEVTQLTNEVDKLQEAIQSKN